MNVHVSHHAERIIRSHIRSGKFSSESEVIDAALGLLEQHVQPPAAGKPVTEEEFKQQLLESGLMSSLPVRTGTAACRIFQPIQLEGEPLSESIIRERR
jgi:Arc/MetJ-type ribon-helix-helix transcriptional regulator